MGKCGILVLILCVLSLSSCGRLGYATKGTMEGTTRAADAMVTTTGAGVYESGKGLVEATKSLAEGVGKGIRGEESAAVQAGEEASRVGGEAIKGIIVEPLKAIGRGLEEIDKGIRKGLSEDIK